MIFREAVRADLPAIVALLADDVLGKWVIAQARRRGCGLVQLTTDKSRVDAHRFYERLGFVASHEGMKLPLP
ncbi:hypothetical protein O7627_09930 [Solwaraspora sp. WMMD1047]|uniref:GNAT family N-acetyltransferase n=1 Tax=Solwaraspora sp. WMMD1047 TaxID=3016102 RepID=UPI002417AC0F|nr:GNAT family N-acetyltransferase [Solwaraspora sp. WMMD1047]MDG4829620.1 hypothetical protein [Solwaraspora sp. WMMD1047]